MGDIIDFSFPKYDIYKLAESYGFTICEFKPFIDYMYMVITDKEYIKSINLNYEKIIILDPLLCNTSKNKLIAYILVLYSYYINNSDKTKTFDMYQKNGEYLEYDIMLEAVDLLIPDERFDIVFKESCKKENSTKYLMDFYSVDEETIKIKLEKHIINKKYIKKEGKKK